MKTTPKKLVLNQETVRNLTEDDLSKVVGGFATKVACTNTCVNSCNGTCPLPPVN